MILIIARTLYKNDRTKFSWKEMQAFMSKLGYTRRRHVILERYKGVLDPQITDMASRRKTWTKELE